MSKRIHTDSEDDNQSIENYETITLQDKGRPKGSKDIGGKRKMTQAKWEALKKAQEALKAKREAKKVVEAPAFNKPIATSRCGASSDTPKTKPKETIEYIEEEPEVIRKIIKKKKKVIEEVYESDSSEEVVVRKKNHAKKTQPQPDPVSSLNPTPVAPQPKNLTALDYLLSSYGYNPFTN
jgi:hypothetical protein